MDRKNQYYSIIKNIVEQHKKYVGLEAILDDIIEDVYSHSEIILKSVANESVISAYLAKVVSTSIITVPKKMNFHPEIKHRNIVINEPSEGKYTKVDNSLVDKMINTSEVKEVKEEASNVITSEQLEEPIVANSDLDVISIEPDEQTEVIENTLIIEQNDTPEENTEEVSLILEEPQPIREEYTKVDNSLVDKMINSSERVEEITFVNDSSEDLTDNTLQEENLEQNMNIVQDDIITFKPENTEEEEEISALDIVNIEPNDNQTEVIENNALDETPSIIFANETETEVNETEEVFGDTESFTFETLSTDSDDTLDVIQPELTENIEEEEEEIVEVNNIIEENELLLDSNEDSNDDFFENEIEEQPEDTDSEDELAIFGNDDSELGIEIDDSLSIEDDNLSEVDENISFDNSLAVEDDTDEIVELVMADDTEEEASVLNFKPLDYSSFEFVPNTGNENLDVSLIVKELKDLDDKKPELDIIDIYNLKYKENLQISQIASKLDISEDSVIEALNEIIAVI